MANFFSSGAPHVHILPQFCSDSAGCLVCDHNCVILRTNRARRALNKEIVDLRNEESISGVRRGRASLQLRREVYRECLKSKSTAKVSFKLFGVIYINRHQPRSHNAARAARAG